MGETGLHSLLRPAWPPPRSLLAKKAKSDCPLRELLAKQPELKLDLLGGGAGRLPAQPSTTTCKKASYLSKPNLTALPLQSLWLSSLSGMPQTCLVGEGNCHLPLSSVCLSWGGAGTEESLCLQGYRHAWLGRGATLRGHMRMEDKPEDQNFKDSIQCTDF